MITVLLIAQAVAIIYTVRLTDRQDLRIKLLVAHCRDLEMRVTQLEKELGHDGT